LNISTMHLIFGIEHTTLFIPTIYDILYYLTS